MSFQIDFDVPLPVFRRAGRAKSTVRSAIEALIAAPTGASVLIPNEAFEELKGRPIWRVSGTCTLFGKGWFACRTTEGGVRIWKLSAPATTDPVYPRKAA